MRHICKTPTSTEIGGPATYRAGVRDARSVETSGVGTKIELRYLVYALYFVLHGVRRTM